jgi:hypothetical protein
VTAIEATHSFARVTLLQPLQKMMMHTNWFPAANLVANFPRNNVRFALIQAKLANLNFHMKNICHLHWRVQEIANIMGFPFFTTRNFKGSSRPRYSEGLCDSHGFCPIR